MEKNVQLTNSTFVASKGGNSLTFSKSKMTDSNVDAGQGSDEIAFTGKSTLDGVVVSLGDDKAKDRLIFSKKTLKRAEDVVVDQFGKKDELVIGKKTFDYSNLQDRTFDNLTIIFKSKNGSSFQARMEDPALPTLESEMLSFAGLTEIG